MLHTGKNHWVTVSTIGCKDSEIFLYISQTSFLTTSLTKQITSLLATPKKNITVMYVDVQMQDGNSNCGLFAIAFAATLANGGQPGTCGYNQTIMRAHFLQCLEKIFLTPFLLK